MNKAKADPLNPPIEDIQGHQYQHELGDPDNVRQIERALRKRRGSGQDRVRATVTEISEYRKQKSADPDLPLKDYPKLDVEQILTRALALSPDEIDRVIGYERRHKNRKIVLESLERTAA